MKIFRYIQKGDLLYPDENGKIIVIIENNLVKAFDENKKEIDKPKFWLDEEDQEIIRKIKIIEYKLNQSDHIDELDSYIAYYPRERKIRLYSYLGKLFEDYVFDLLKSRYNVERNKEIFISSKLYPKSHNKPDFIIEKKLAIEAKTRKNNFEQTLEYSKYFKYGAIVFPFSGICNPPKFWSCIYDTIIDNSRLFSWIEIYLHK
ncbi:hypothetical protein DFR86_02040 [Acidianus sulfidivorans JP7]|uniref:Uncharacterized protein n=1 Tax=Acidianus sulfidivorans JP7 TaxID=619593 RepID=A0A2U9IK96_9CREN|nr:hypothetical protein [Acidianus sulfidivorans]AWR96448.1 hypothetical protein DFR86_02040 [Acidianus sulfidivorans JP7]